MTAVMPVLDGIAFLRRSLPPLMARVGLDLAEVLVVDDGCTDGSATYAAELGARILATSGRVGPAAARNLGVAQCTTPLVLFVDADVVLHGDAVGRARRALADPSWTAVFGSYDDHPTDPGFFSRWKNLQHHAVHQRSGGLSSTFWSGCGAVRRSAFLDAGGFDAVRFPTPSIEDIDLGYRLRAAGGRVLLDPELQATHLKRWALIDLLRTDIGRRALPWSRLLLRHPEAASDLNVAPGERARAGVAVAFLASLVLPLWAGGASAALPFVLLCLAARLNAPLLRLFARRHGAGFAFGGALFLQIHYTYATATYGYAVLERVVERAQPRAG